MASTAIEQQAMLCRALVEIGAALDALDLLPDDHPGLDWACGMVAAEARGAFAHLALPQPPRGGSKPLPPPPGYTPEQIAANRAAADRRLKRRPTWGRRRIPRVVDLNREVEKASR